MRAGKAVVVLGCVVALGAVVGACREDEQGRVLMYEKGVYLGKPDTAVSEGALRALSARIQRQNEHAGPAGGGPPAGQPAGVRPPTTVDALRQRARRQD